MRRELLRQIVHLAVGLLLAVLAATLPREAFLLACAGILLVIGGSLALRLPLAERILKSMQRTPPPVVPAKGAVFMVAGALLTGILFPEHLVVALLVTATADSIATVIGMYHGRPKVPWSPKKSVWGVGSFLAVSAVLLIPFTPWWLLGGILLTALESVDFQQADFLDDNMLLPLATGAFLVIF